MMTIATIDRAAIKAHAAARGCRYRITSRGEVDFYGPMPNNGAPGWYHFAIDVREALELIAREQA